MQQHIIIVGAGIIGAAAAFHLSQHARVTVIAGQAARATDASFGWINASYYLDDAHFHLRHVAIDAYHRLKTEIDIPVQTQPSLCWETSGTAFDAQHDHLVSLGADVRVVDADAFHQLEPSIATPPRRALLFRNEAVASSGDLADTLLSAAQARGARVVAGLSVQGLLVQGNQVTGIDTHVGEMSSDQVLVCAGTGTEQLMSTAGVNVPMLYRPGLMIKTRPVAPILKHVLASPEQEVRQLPCGALLAPSAASHQSDNAVDAEMPVNDLADQTITRLCQLLPDVALAWDSAILANRPMPQDGLPVVGPCGPQGLYVATMHSGITLAALMGELLAEEILTGVSNTTADILAPYRPQRFSQ